MTRELKLVPEPEEGGHVSTEWADGHAKLDDFRFKIVFAVLGAAMTMFIGVAGWSLKTQYDVMAKNEAHALEQLNALYAVSGQVHELDKKVPPPNAP